ncbi:putative LuxR family transcriptional regulator [Beijerinckiaceae bacterium RH AL1]|nr:hypothetical protein [Beijerinckiaceae bacterium]VVB42379.1 putative LuxR family transcriptional regulator [Beijerinckiaceae bacterium RH AL8]VVB42380.1 putative LuxR family transcriptional regulator [Beijerinckiaceae bacterium RH CH11]VVC53279.1 putative LuxR family transcriptional regulator [Beijerinckiaceae bacterium RH AL1]
MTESAVVAAFYESVQDDGMLQQAVTALADYFDSPSACLGEVDHVSGRWMVGSGKVDSAQLTRYAEISGRDPAPRAFSVLRVCTASTSDRMFSERELRKSAFLNEYLSPAGLDHSMGSPLHLDAGRFSLVGIHQARHRPRYDNGDIALLERLTPHLARTLQLRRNFSMLRARHDSFEALIDAKDTGLIGTHRGTTLFVNKAAQLLGGDGLSLDRHGRPVVMDGAAAKRLARFEYDVVRGGAGGYVHVPRPSGAPSYIVLVSRLPGGFGPIDGIGVLFSIHDPARRQRPTADLIGALLQLPRAPSRVIAALLNGQSLRDYAEEAGLSLETVRCQLKAAFAQTETHSQVELVRLALSALTATEHTRPEPSAAGL